MGVQLKAPLQSLTVASPCLNQAIDLAAVAEPAVDAKLKPMFPAGLTQFQADQPGHFGGFPL